MFLTLRFIVTRMTLGLAVPQTLLATAEVIE